MVGSDFLRRSYNDNVHVCACYVCWCAHWPDLVTVMNTVTFCACSNWCPAFFMARYSELSMSLQFSLSLHCRCHIHSWSLSAAASPEVVDLEPLMKMSDFGLSELVTLMKSVHPIENHEQDHRSPNSEDPTVICRHFMGLDMQTFYSWYAVVL